MSYKVQILSWCDDQATITVWEPSSPMGKHGTVTAADFGGQWYGKVGTNPDRSKIDHLPAYSGERVAAADAEYLRLHVVAMIAIAGVLPELADAARAEVEKAQAAGVPRWPGELAVSGELARGLARRFGLKGQGHIAASTVVGA